MVDIFNKSFIVFELPLPRLTLCLYTVEANEIWGESMSTVKLIVADKTEEKNSKLKMVTGLLSEHTW